MAQSQTKWVKRGEEPPIGGECPICKSGQIKNSQYGLCWCPECRTGWKESKYGKTNGYQKPKITGEQIIMEELQAFRKEFNDRMDSLAKFLATKEK